MLIIFPRPVRQQRPFSQRAGTAVLRFLARTQPPDRAPGGGPPIDHYLAHALLRLAGAGAVEVLPAEVWSER